MTELADQQIAVELSFSEEVWEALTADLKDFWRECHEHSSAPDMALPDRIDLFVQEQTTQWISRLPEKFRSAELDDGMPF